MVESLLLVEFLQEEGWVLLLAIRRVGIVSTMGGKWMRGLVVVMVY